MQNQLISQSTINLSSQTKDLPQTHSQAMSTGMNGTVDGVNTSAPITSTVNTAPQLADTGSTLSISEIDPAVGNVAPLSANKGNLVSVIAPADNSEADGEVGTAATAVESLQHANNMLVSDESKNISSIMCNLGENSMNRPTTNGTQMVASKPAAVSTKPTVYGRSMSNSSATSSASGGPVQKLILPAPSSATSSSPSPGYVVESGQEHTGRWTKEEHEAFLKALKMYGKEWKKVAAKVKTRTVVQTRTHAQKYFQKLQKARSDENSTGTVTVAGDADMGVSLNVDLVGGLGHQANAIAAAAAAAGVGGKGKNAGGHACRTKGILMAASKGQGKRQMPQAVAPVAASPLPSSRPTLPYLPTPESLYSKVSPPEKMSYGAAAVAAAVAKATATSSAPSSVVLANGSPNTTSNTTNRMKNTSLTSTGTDRYGVTRLTTPLKIVAPTPDNTRSGIPPPSPAACGKRKLAEIAAAQMLAGVFSSGGSKGGDEADVGKTSAKFETSRNGTSSADVPSCADANMAAPHAMHPSSGTSTIGTRAPSLNTEFKSTFPKSASEGVNKFLTPCSSPRFMPSSFTSSLQIVNPEALGVTVGGKRSRGAPGSPSTPWDGQMEALLSEIRNKEAAVVDSSLLIDATPSTGGNGINSIATNEETQEEPPDYHPLHPLPRRPGVCSTRLALHEAIRRGDINETKRVLKLNVATKDSISSLLMLNVKEDSKTSDDVPLCSQNDVQGFSPLHAAASLDVINVGAGVPAEMTRVLISAGANTRCTDKRGNTALHWAARAGNGDVSHLLTLKNCLLDAQNDDGETALHWAMRAGHKGQSTVRVLIEDGARHNVFNKSFRRPLDLAGMGFEGVDKNSKSKSAKGKANMINTETSLLLNERRDCRANLLSSAPNARTLVLHHPECLEHIPKNDSDWECPDRVTAILSKLTESRSTEETQQEKETDSPKSEFNHSGSFRFSPREITVSTEFDRASLELISRVHSAEYLTFVNDLSKMLEKRMKEENGNLSTPPSVPFTPNVQRKVLKGKDIKENSHSDTSFSSGSLRAARRAAGAVQHAVDRVLTCRNRNAFCIVRPPGHHAGVNGLLENSESCGFCIFNNVAAGAMHALSERHQSRCERCAIVDIDVHHGNGTEEIVQRAHDPTRLLFFSVHLYDNSNVTNSGKYDRTAGNSGVWNFYPGTGDKDDVANNVINVPIAPLWKEKEILAATSLVSSTTPTSTNTHNTRQKNRQKAAAAVAAARKDPNKNVPNKYEDSDSTKSSEGLPDIKANKGDTSRRASPVPPAPAPPAHYLLGTGHRAYRRAIRSRLLPALRAFNPDLILISAGFDATRDDVGNAKHMAGGRQRMGMDLDPEDYAWTTRKIMEVADICCQGRVVSVLEGGYGRTPRDGNGSSSSESNKNNNKGLLDKSVFAESAMRHLRALIDPYNAEKRHPRREGCDDSDDDEDEIFK